MIMNTTCAYKGRDNLALTVFVPSNCANNCPFCTSKKDYSLHRCDAQAVKKTYLEIISSQFFKKHVSDIVFTGGEPTNDLELLDWFLMVVNRFNKNVFINTTMPLCNYDKFLAWAKNSSYAKMIRGISVSRHGINNKEDCELLHQPTEREQLLDFMSETGIPIRINCVVSERESSEKLACLLNRWSYPFTLNLREDYTQMTENRLHNPYSMNLTTLSNLECSYQGKTSCRVCDTTVFKAGDNQSTVLYHKGLEHTFITGEDGKKYFHDIILFQDGKAFLDWDRKHSFSAVEDTLLPCDFTTLPTEYGCGDFVFAPNALAKKTRPPQSAPVEAYMWEQRSCGRYIDFYPHLYSSSGYVCGGRRGGC